MKRGVARWWQLGLSALLASPAMPRAQEQRFGLRRDGNEVCSVEVVPVVGGGGNGWLRVEIDNLDDRPHRVEVGYRCTTSSGGEASSRRRFDVQPGGRHVRGFLMFAHGAAAAPYLNVQVDGNVVGNTYIAAAVGSPSFLLVTELQTAPMRALCEAAFGTVKSVRGVTVPVRGGSRPVLIANVEPSALPTDWPLLSGFDVAVIDGAERLTGQGQETLRSYCAAGGTLLIGHADRMQAGPLANLLATGDECGLGRIIRVEDFAPTTAQVSALSAQFAGLGGKPGPVPTGWYACMQIPGLGEIPGRMFLLVILLFAVLVGPVNLWWLRRRKRPMLALITVPALGFGCTACILGYGLLHDGLGLQGVQRSFTVLDQRQHEAAAIVTRTLFAGMSPGPLQVGNASFVDTPDSAQRSMVFDADQGTIAGTILPSRQPTALVSAQHGMARARLRFRAAATGGLEALTDGTLQPPQQWLLRDFDGNYFLGAGTSLRPVDANRAQHFVKDGRTVTSEPFVMRQFPGGDLPNGSYLLQTAAAPWIDDFGLEVDWLRSEHCVLGRLGREDFLP